MLSRNFRWKDKGEKWMHKEAKISILPCWYIVARLLIQPLSWQENNVNILQEALRGVVGKEEAEEKYFDGGNKEESSDREERYYGGNGRRGRKNEGIEWAEVARTGRLQPPWLPLHWGPPIQHTTTLCFSSFSQWSVTRVAHQSSKETCIPFRFCEAGA